MSFGYRIDGSMLLFLCEWGSLYIQSDNFTGILYFVYFLIYNKKPCFSYDKKLNESSLLWRSQELSDATS